MTERRRYVSTRRESPPTDLEQALFDGPAPDGGLYIPEPLEPMRDETIDGFVGSGLSDVAVAVAQHLFRGELEESALEEITRDALDFPVPLVEVEPGIWALELFWGPTHAFKDVAARFMARLMQHFSRRSEADARTVLVATSGDTGSAVAQAFWKLSGFRVCVLFPREGVSEAQRRLFSTLGENVSAVAIDGTFDDCQRLVRECFADERLRSDYQFASANSINVCRLLPQTFYYFYAAAQLAASGGSHHPYFVTPSGNFGNLTAGLIAKRLGLRTSGFVAATNANDVFPEYLATGRYRARKSVRTYSNAMDVGDPSNFRRIEFLYDGDVDAVRRDVDGYTLSDADTLKIITEVNRDRGYLLDPHSAIGYAAAAELRNTRNVDDVIFLATAHPAKFSETVEQATDVAVESPKAIVEAFSRTEDFATSAARLEELRPLLSTKELS